MGYSGTLGVNTSELEQSVNYLKQAIRNAETDRSYLETAKGLSHRASGDVENAIIVLDQTKDKLEQFSNDLTSYKDSVEEFDQKFSKELSEINLERIVNSDLPTTTFSILWKEAGYISSCKLQNKFPLIEGKFFGGNQSWFGIENKIGQDGGCGTTATANILAYMALNNPDLAKALGINKDTLLTQDGYTAFMKQVYQVVTPFKTPFANELNKRFNWNIPITLGVWPVSSMADKTVDFAKENGVDLTYKSLTVSDISVGDLFSPYPSEATLPKHISYNEGIKFIQEGLRKDCPVALLNTFNKVSMTGATRNSSTQQHWVTITQVEYNAKTFDYNLTVSSWGEEFTISYNELHKSWQDIKAIDSGLVYFELED